MQSQELSSTIIFQRFLSRTALGRVMHAFINWCVILQFCSPQAQPTWAADAVVNALGQLQSQTTAQADPLTLSLVKNQPLGHATTLDGPALAPDAGPQAAFTWFGPFGSVVDPTPSLFLPEGHSTLTLLVEKAGSPPQSHQIAVDVAACFALSARAKPGKVQLTWPQVPTAQRYEVYRATAAEPSQFTKIGEATSAAFLVENLANEASYLYIVGAFGPDLVCFSAVTAAHPTLTRGTVNHPPVIYSEAVRLGTLDLPYNYDVNAADPEGHSLTYALALGPQDMTIDPGSGLISWIPTVGFFEVRARVEDPGGLFAEQSFTIAVAEIQNTPPIANAGPDQSALVTQTVTLDGSQSSDPDGDPLTYHWSLISQPQNSAAVLSDPNAVNPTFLADGAGTYIAQLIVNDGKDDSTADTVNIAVDPLPVTVPDVVGLTQAAAESAILAANLTVGAVTTANSDTVPAGQVISQNPLAGASVPPGTAVALVISLGPTNVAVPNVVGLTQAAGESAILAANLTVGAVTTANSDTVPAGQVISQNPLAGASVPPGTAVALVISLGPLRAIVPNLIGLTQLQAQSALFQAQLLLGEVVAQNHPSAPPGEIFTQNPSPGTVLDPGLAVDFTVSAGASVSDGAFPEVTIHSPAPDAQLTSLTDIIATITDANLSFYHVHIARSDKVNPNDIAADDPDYQLIAEGSANVSNAVIGTFDPSALESDSYVIRVKAMDQGGLITAKVVTVSVPASAKAGQFSLEFIDLSVPLVGIPIQVVRRYNSFQANDQGDFGFGWKLGFLDADIRTTTPDQGSSFFDQTAFIDNVTRVYITTPEGKRVGFTFFLQFVANTFFGPTYAPRFRPDPGVYEKLQTLGIDGGLSRRADGRSVLFLFGFPWRPDNYVLTLTDGKAYSYTGAGALQNIRDLSGNTVQFTPLAITHSSGESIQLVRDAQNRITEIVDPTGHSILYSYDGKGDLVSVTDQAGQETRFTYHPVPQHYLNEVIDPLGRQAQRTEYDETGRIIAVIDALGNRIEQNFDPSNFVGTTTDARGPSRL